MTSLLSKRDVNVWLACAVAALGTVSFLLELMGTDIKGNADEYEEIGKTEQESPFVRANIYSQWSFGWMTPLMKVRVGLFVNRSIRLKAVIVGVV
jgi:ATP-binding cassette, subfamily C (CFTR/MRP), member 1